MNWCINMPHLIVAAVVVGVCGVALVSFWLDRRLGATPRWLAFVCVGFVAIVWIYVALYWIYRLVLYLFTC